MREHGFEEQAWSVYLWRSVCLVSCKQMGGSRVRCDVRSRLPVWIIFIYFKGFVLIESDN